MNSVRKVNEEVTCLKALNAEREGDASVVATAGRDGWVRLVDLRSGGKVGEVRSGEFFSEDLIPCFVKIFSSRFGNFYVQIWACENVYFA